MGIAEGASGWIQAILNQLNKIDLTGIGQSIGHWISALPEAFKQARLGELFELTLTVAFQNAVNVLGKLLQGVAAAFPGMMSAAMGAGMSLTKSGYAASADAVALATLMEAKLFPVGSKEYAGHMQVAAAASGAADKLRGSAADDVRAAVEAAAKGIGAGMSNKGVDIIGSDGAKLKALIDSLQPEKVEELFNAPKKTLEGGPANEKLTRPKTSDYNALERVGLVRFGIGGSEDYTRQTAQHTRHMIDVMDGVKTILEKINQDQQGSGTFGNV